MRLWFKRYWAQYVGGNILLARVWPGFYIYLDGRDGSVIPSLLQHHSWEYPLHRQIRRSLPRGGTFVDIGAHFGYHALGAARQVGPTGTVVAIEPQAELCRLMERSIGANDYFRRMQVMCLAIGADERAGSLGKIPFLTGSASFKFGSDVPDREEARIVPLPAALATAEEGLGRPVVPDVIKIDVEGFEFEVWDGMKDWTRSCDRLTILLEYSPIRFRNAGRDPLELLRQFREYGFGIFRLGRWGLKPVDDAACARIAADDGQIDLVLRK